MAALHAAAPSAFCAIEPRLAALARMARAVLAMTTLILRTPSQADRRTKVEAFWAAWVELGDDEIAVSVADLHPPARA